MSSLPRQAAEKGAPLQLSPRLGQSLCEGDAYSVPARLCCSTERPSRRLRLLSISSVGLNIVLGLEK